MATKQELHPFLEGILNEDLKLIRIIRTYTDKFPSEQVANKIVPECDPCEKRKADYQIILTHEYFGKKQQKSFWFRKV